MESSEPSNGSSEVVPKGQIHLESWCPLNNPLCENVKKGAVEEKEEFQKKVSPPGKNGNSPLGLPPLLEARRLEHQIPDRAFACRAAYDRVFVWQVWIHKEETYLPGGNIVQPANFREGDLRENPHGIILSAGLGALDSLRSNGIDLGHHVTIIHVQPWRLPVGISDHEGVLMLQAGDITGSHDLELALRSGAVRIVVRLNEHGQRIHRFEDAEGNVWDPTMPWVADDM